MRRRFEALAAATERRDVPALLAFYTDGFDDQEPEGQHLTKTDLARLAAARPKTAVRSNQSTEVLSIDVSGPFATVVYLHYTRAVRSLEDGTMARVEIASRNRDRWVLIGGGWYLDRSVVDARDLYVDGTPSQHAGLGTPVDP